MKNTSAHNSASVKSRAAVQGSLIVDSPKIDYCEHLKVTVGEGKDPSAFAHIDGKYLDELLALPFPIKEKAVVSYLIEISKGFH